MTYSKRFVATVLLLVACSDPAAPTCQKETVGLLRNSMPQYEFYWRLGELQRAGYTCSAAGERYHCVRCVR